MGGHKDVRFLVFDIESIADGNLIASLKYPGEGLEPEEAIARYRADLLEKYDSDFIPYTFQIPASLAIAKVDKNFVLTDLTVLDEELARPHVITEHFWRGWTKHHQPTLVTFNGRTFDLPLLELSAFRYGIGIPKWLDLQGRSYDQPRNRYNTESHLDVHDVLTNFGASRFTGGLNLAAQLLGKPGKMDVQGHMVQDLYHQGRLSQIHAYCRCDVLDTYFVFLRCAVMMGWLSLDEEQKLIEKTHRWIESRAGEVDGFTDYLAHWGDWPNPWNEPENVTL